jgi:hypothetical protein
MQGCEVSLRGRRQGEKKGRLAYSLLWRAGIFLFAWLTLACFAQSCPAPDEDEMDDAAAIEQTADQTIAAPVQSAARGDSPAAKAIRGILASGDFNPQETIRYPALKKKQSDEKEVTPQWMRMLEKFFRVAAQVVRAGAWVLGGIGLVILVLALHYWWRIPAVHKPVAALDLPIRVGGLDIAPGSLPGDIGGEARQRWLAGDASGALSLLYRGALSALVTRYRAAIRASSTEEECLRAAHAVLGAAHAGNGAEQEQTPRPASYFESLTRAWQSTVYAGRLPESATALALCDAFARHFPVKREQAA